MNFAYENLALTGLDALGIQELCLSRLLWQQHIIFLLKVIETFVGRFTQSFISSFPFKFLFALEFISASMHHICNVN